MKSNIFKKVELWWGDLPDKFSGNNNLAVINVVNALLFPLLVVLSYRLFEFVGVIVNLMLWTMWFSLSFSQSKQIRTGLNMFSSKEKHSPTERLCLSMMLYIILPIICVFILMPIYLSLVMPLFPSNPQGLGSVPSDARIFLDILGSIQAGAEEIWRFSFIFTLMIFFKKQFINHWGRTQTKWLSLFIAIIVSSFVFGWLHTFGYSEVWFNTPITLLLGYSGLFYAVIILITRRLWVAIITHIIWDISSTFSRSQYSETYFMSVIVILLVCLIIVLTNMLMQKKTNNVAFSE